jgi:hypothetical protein
MGELLRVVLAFAVITSFCSTANERRRRSRLRGRWVDLQSVQDLGGWRSLAPGRTEGTSA